jgi:acetyl-CoA acetyltransferase
MNRSSPRTTLEALCALAPAAAERSPLATRLRSTTAPLHSFSPTPRAKELGVMPMARIVAQASMAPIRSMCLATPVEAIRRVLTKTGWEDAESILFEIGSPSRSS